eukprot:COSAG06_NODE_1836_length_8255_cov_18.050515_1_plen_238_part_00
MTYYTVWLYRSKKCAPRTLGHPSVPKFQPSCLSKMDSSAAILHSPAGHCRRGRADRSRVRGRADATRGRSITRPRRGDRHRSAARPATPEYVYPVARPGPKDDDTTMAPRSLVAAALLALAATFATVRSADIDEAAREGAPPHRRRRVAHRSGTLDISLSHTASLRARTGPHARGTHHKNHLPTVQETLASRKVELLANSVPPCLQAISNVWRRPSREATTSITSQPATGTLAWRPL